MEGVFDYSAWRWVQRGEDVVHYYQSRCMDQERRNPNSTVKLVPGREVTCLLCLAGPNPEILSKK